MLSLDAYHERSIEAPLIFEPERLVGTEGASVSIISSSLSGSLFSVQDDRQIKRLRNMKQIFFISNGVILFTNKMGVLVFLTELKILLNSSTYTILANRNTNFRSLFFPLPTLNLAIE